MKFRTYVFPPAGTSSGPVMSENTRSRAFVDRLPSRHLGTGHLVCLPTMQCSHIGGMVDRSVGIPIAMCFFAISIIDA
jgi:hypothetical protein